MHAATAKSKSGSHQEQRNYALKIELFVARKIQLLCAASFPILYIFPYREKAASLHKAKSLIFISLKSCKGFTQRRSAPLVNFQRLLFRLKTDYGHSLAAPPCISVLDWRRSRCHLAVAERSCAELFRFSDTTIQK